MNRKQRRAAKKPDRPVVAQGTSPSVQQVFANAVRCHQAGHLNEAERLYRQILAVVPHHADSLHLLGAVACQVGHHALAVDMISKAIAINVKSAEYHSTLSLALTAQGKLDEAIASYRAALALKPDFAEAHNNLGNLLRGQGKVDEAVAQYQRAVALKPDFAEAYNNLGNALKDRGKLVEAVACYRRALALKPNYAEAHNNLGNAIKDQGKLDDAVACYRRALALKPGYATAYNNLGNALKDQEKLEEAVACYRRALDLNPSYAEAHFNLGILLNDQGKLDEAIAQYQRAIALKPNLAEAHNNLGNAFNDQGTMDGALTCYRSAIAIKPNYAEAYNNLGTLLYDQGKLEEAVVQYRSALALKPDYAEAHHNLGTTLRKLGRFADAEASYRRALEIDPEDTLGTRLLLASVGIERMPMRASEAHLNKLYLKRSHNWDLGTTRYFAHQLVADALKRLPHKSQKFDILDAGCGTGLVGVLVRDLASKLDGIDMSLAMLEKAREKNVYDCTYLGDLTSFMAENSNCYDVITCAATLIHFGDLTPVLNAAASCLRDGGLFVFTLFLNNVRNDQEVIVPENGSLAMGGCFAHSAGYVRRLAEDTDFSVDILESRIHEYDKNFVPIMGLVVALRLRPVVS